MVKHDSGFFGKYRCSEHWDSEFCPGDCTRQCQLRATGTGAKEPVVVFEWWRNVGELGP